MSREEHRLRIQRKMFESKRDEVARDGRKLRNENLRGL
jgi:hypothetical protein